MPRAGIALGSNLGPRLASLQAARELLRRLAHPAAELLQAPVYQTAPLACPDGSPDFFNTVVEIGYDGSPAELLRQTQAIEQSLGRTRGATRHAPRLIDIDLLYCGAATHAGDGLDIPHPRLTQRRFVLQPLADIRPELILPGHYLTIAAHLAGLPDGEPAPLLVHSDW
ncbi:MAG: 2-amino-4-hydroxy-6-hydroxymethyldihydropteridine diphosphokinase [Verrucomicrobia bacterium]|nr:MAG: 2-amino-4-hydroxy-6-hydroxymethyldihydropteridine diphosphokinase [Verrucomicrobiota bacterium]